MKIKRYNRVLYAAGAVLFVVAFVSDTLDLLMTWDDLTRAGVARRILHLPLWSLMIYYCVSEYRRRKGYGV